MYDLNLSPEHIEAALRAGNRQREFTENEQIQRGRHMKALLEDEFVRDLMDTVRGRLIARWAGSTERHERETAWVGLQTLLLVMSIAQEVISDGQVAEEQMRQED